MDFNTEAAGFLVLVNDEHQHCIWAAGIAVPAGWREIERGDEAHCLAFVERNWTDMRPASLAAHRSA